MTSICQPGTLHSTKSPELLSEVVFELCLRSDDAKRTRGTLSMATKHSSGFRAEKVLASYRRCIARGF